MYFLQVQRGQSHPNAATWIIWLFVDILNLASYGEMVHDEPFKAYTAFASTVNACVIFAYAAWNHHFAKIDLVDVVLLAITVIIAAVWKITGNATLSNVLLQSVFVISFSLTIRSVWKGAHEHPAAWLVAVFAYLLSIVAIILTWDSAEDGWQLAFPIVNGVLGNGSIPLTLWIVHRRRA